ncbi:hypothetical protein D3C81_1488390 [compost metagenome]
MAIVDAVADRGDGLEAAGHGVEIADLLQPARAVLHLSQGLLLLCLLPLDRHQVVCTGRDQLGLGHGPVRGPFHIFEFVHDATTDSF